MLNEEVVSTEWLMRYPTELKETLKAKLLGLFHFIFSDTDFPKRSQI